MTEMACDEALMDQDTRLADLLMASPTVALDGDDLVLTAADASITTLAAGAVCRAASPSLPSAALATAQVYGFCCPCSSCSPCRAYHRALLSGQGDDAPQRLQYERH